MKKYFACLIDKDNPIYSPLFVYNYQQIRLSPTYADVAHNKVINIVSTKYKFGYIIDEINHENRKSLGNISHVVTNIRWENNKLMVEIMTLDTVQGKLLESLLDNGMIFCLSYNWADCGYCSIDVHTLTNEPANKEYMLVEKYSKRDFK